jgi:hypothetical protein
MSELKKKINETALNELMVSIRRNAKDSACIKNFEDLLHEIDDPEFVNITVNSMTNFMSEWFELLGAAVTVPQKKFRSKMLTTQFIEPLRFFGRVKKMADEQMKKRAIIEDIEIYRATLYYQNREINDSSVLRRSGVTVNTERKRINVTNEEIEKFITDNAAYELDESMKGSYGLVVDVAHLSDDDFERLLPYRKDVKELARKEMLVWNYIPGVIKAVIQTKRREMNMDNNSKRF